MKLLSMMKFQLKNILPWLLAFYIVMVVQLQFSGYNENVIAGTPMGNAVIFSFFIGLFSFRQNFRMALAQGVSRRSMFLSSFLMLVLLSVLTVFLSFASAQLLLTTATKRYTDYHSPFYLPGSVSRAQGQLYMIVPWFIGLCITAAFLGYLIAVLFYYWRGFSAFARITWITSGLLILFVIFGLELSVISLFLTSFIYGFADYLALNISFIYLPFAFSSLLFAAASWLLIRRATITAPSPAPAAQQAN